MKKRFVIILILLLLCSCAASAFAVPALAFAASELEAKAEESVNSAEAPSCGTYLSPAELLQIFTGGSASLGEAEYLDSKTSLSFSYDIGFSSEGVRLVLPKDSAYVQVYAKEYPAHEAASGVSVSWVPVYAERGGVRKYFSPSDDAEYKYSAELPSGADGDVSVTYEGRFVFSAETVNEITSFAYDAAVIACAKIDAENARYDALLAEFNTQSAQYKQYLADMAEYESKAALYDAYIKECEAIQKDYSDAVREYESLMREYEISRTEYEEKLAEYDAAVKDYERELLEYDYYITVAKPNYDKEYGKYLEYLDALDEYNAKYLKYEEYRTNSQKYLAHLEILNTAKIPMTDGRSLYDAIMGTTVDTVLERQDEIVAAGAPKELVNKAGRATKILRALFEAYFDLSTDEERYHYYATYYRSFKTSLLDLLQSLDYFYKMNGGTGLVYTKLTEEEKGKKYVILLAQLYILTSAITDERIYDYDGKTEFTDSYTWTYAMSLSDHNAGRRYTVTAIEMLEGKRYLTDTNSAKPYTDPFPQPQDEPEKPVAVQKPAPLAPCSKPNPPVMPTEPKPPKAPDAPTMPTEVKKPTEPTHIDDPGEPPQPYAPTEEESRLAALMSDGSLVKRDERDDGFCLTREHTVTKSLADSAEATVYFYSSASYDSLIYFTVADVGSAVSFTADLPKKPSDENYHYLFDGWADEDGNRVDLNSIGSGHIYLHPIYKSFNKDDSFTVTWNIDGREYITYCKYGEIPSCDVIPQKEKDGSFVYTFSSWDKEPVPAMSDAVYTAVFSSVRYYKISWLVDGEEIAVTECLENEMPTFPNEAPTKPDDSYGRYVFSGWDRAFERPSSDTSYEAVFDVIRYYTVTWTVDGVSVLETKCLENELPTFPNVAPTKPDDSYGRYVFSGWDRAFECPSSDTSYEAVFDVIRYYTVTWTVNGVSVLETKCLENELPVFSADAPVKASDGMYRYAFSGWDRELEYLSSDTSYEAQFTRVRLYTVSWISDGSVIATERFDEGSIPVPPKDAPARAPDSVYKYTFTGWNKTLAPLTSDTEYEAAFERSYIYPCGEGGAELTYSYGKLKLSTLACGSNIIPDFPTLAAISAGRALIIEMPSGTLSISSDSVSAMLNEGVIKITLTANDGGYTVIIEDGQGTVSADSGSAYSIGAQFRSDAPLKPAAGGTLCAVTVGKNGEISTVDAVIGENSFSVAAVKSNTLYRCVELFDIKLFDGIDWISVKKTAMAGERVEFSLDLPVGMKLKSMYYVSEISSEERVNVTGGSFIMPEGGVWLFASLQPIEFSIKFTYYDGTCIVKTCKWGELPEPTVIKKGSDSEYVYTFVSWDREITAAYADAEYIAVYDRTPIDDGDYTRGNFWLLYLITVYRYRRVVIVSVIISLASACAFVSIKIYKKRREKL